MKVVTAQEMARIEQLAYSEGASEEDFMNRAGEGVAQVAQNFIARYHLQPNITLLCGGGNNGGDAYVAGRILLEGGFHVSAYACAPFDRSSPLCQLQSKRFLESGGVIVYLENSPSIEWGEEGLIIDGLLGTGFHGELHGIIKEVIIKANESKLPILAIDIPSGIQGTTGEVDTVAIEATETVFLGLPKTGCFFPHIWENVGKIHVYDFGLSSQSIEAAHEDLYFIDDALIVASLPKILRTRHKYQTGYVVGLGGSLGMPGAPTMACFAALRSGAGIVRLFHPQAMRAELGPAPFEIIREGYEDNDWDPIVKEMQRASAVFFGPGLGISPASHQLLKELIPCVDKPCVIDAEALIVLSQEEIKLPPQSILTPHQGEMKKLLRIREKNLPFSTLFEKSRNYAKEKKITLVLKGAPTFIFHHGHTPYVCVHGDPGMATAGSGDILSGIISGFLAQVGDPLQAAILGVQFHAMAGELAAKKWTSYCLVATDMVNELPHIFKYYIKLEKRPNQSTNRESPLSSWVEG